MEAYQIIVPLISLGYIAWVIRNFINSKNSLFEAVIWGGVWIFIGLVAVFPDAITFFMADVLGIKSHINALLFTAIGVIFLILYRIFQYVKKQDRVITELVRKIALDKRNNEESVHETD